MLWKLLVLRSPTTTAPILVAHTCSRCPDDNFEGASASARLACASCVQWSPSISYQSVLPLLEDTVVVEIHVVRSNAYSFCNHIRTQPSHKLLSIYLPLHFTVVFSVFTFGLCTSSAFASSQSATVELNTGLFCNFTTFVALHGRHRTAKFHKFQTK